MFRYRCSSEPLGTKRDIRGLLQYWAIYRPHWGMLLYLAAAEVTLLARLVHFHAQPNDPRRDDCCVLLRPCEEHCTWNSTLIRYVGTR